MDKISQKINEKTGMFKLSNNDIKKIISTIVERIRTISNENTMLKFVYLDHNIITDSRILTKDFHLSPTCAILCLLDMYKTVITLLYTINISLITFGLKNMLE